MKLARFVAVKLCFQLLNKIAHRKANVDKMPKKASIPVRTVRCVRIPKRFSSNNFTFLHQRCQSELFFFVFSAFPFDVEFFAPAFPPLVLTNLSIFGFLKNSWKKNY